MALALFFVPNENSECNGDFFLENKAYVIHFAKLKTHFTQNRLGFYKITQNGKY